MKYKILSFGLGVLLIISLIFTYTNTLNKNVSYSDYRLKVEKISSEFKPDQFIGINKPPEAPYAHITSYPGHDWTGETNNSYNNNIIDARQIDYYYLSQSMPNVVSKITFFYAPDSLTRDYIKVDYFRGLNFPSVVEAPYVNILVIPHYEVAFKGKGYYVYVQTTYYEEYYRNNQITKDEKDALATLNGDLVRKFQEYLISNEL